MPRLRKGAPGACRRCSFGQGPAQGHQDGGASQHETTGPPGPLVLYAAMGFEATCSLSSKIKDAARNGPKAIYYSFFIVMITIFLFQFCFYALLGTSLMDLKGYMDVFPALAAIFFGGTSLVPYFIALMHFAIACSALGGSYGILYSNSWNLYTLAQHGHVSGAAWLTRLSKWGIPYFCVLIEGILCLAFLLITKGVAALQTHFHQSLTYILSAIALLLACCRAKVSTSFFVPVLGMASCAILFIACIRNLFIHGLLSLGLFAGLGIIGTNVCSK